MDDLRTLLERTASDLDSEPDGWSRVLDRRQHHQLVRRLTAGAVALVVAAGGLSVAALAIHPSTKPALPPGRSNAPNSTGPDHPIAVTLDADGYPATCTATVANSRVAPGDPVSISFVVRNRGDQTLQVPVDRGFDSSRLLVRDASGGLLFDTETLHLGDRGPPLPLTPLKPGQSVTRTTDSAVVRWAGAISLAGTCPTPSRSANGLGDPVRFPRLPEFRLAVVPQGPTPSDADAIDRAVAATKGLYDSCHPGSHGEPVDGVFRPPIPGGVQPSLIQSPTVTAPDPKVEPLPLEATCWAVIDPGPGFADVTLYFSSPQTGSTPPTTGPEGLPSLGPERPTEVGRWEMVVLPGSVVTAGFPTSSGRSPVWGDVDYDINPTTGKWEVGGLSCLAGGFIGGTIHFFPPSGHHACRARFKHV